MKINLELNISMSSPWIVRILMSGLLLALSTTAFGFSTHTDEWTEEALLHDGKVIKINREVYWTFHFLSGGDASPQLMESYPDKYWFKFINPYTKETIKWHGDEDYVPVLLDIMDGVPYLAVHGPQDQKTRAKYLCPEVPYFFYKYDSKGFGSWTQIAPKEFPSILKKANLSPTIPYDIEDYYYTYRGAAPKDIPQPNKELTHDIVWAYIKNDERRSGGRLQSIIANECPVWQKPAAIILPSPQKVTLEILESKEYSPEKPFNPDDLFDKEKSKACVKLIKLEDPKNPLKNGRYLFVKDKSELNAIQLRPFALPFFNMVCDGEDVWFPSYDKETGIELTKYSSSGELVYRVRFQSPFPALIIFSSVKAIDGYLYFDLWDSQINAQGGRLKRSLKVRFLEPKVERSRYRGEIFPNHQITQHNFVSPSNGILITVPRGDDIDSPHTHPRALRAQSPATAELPQAQRHAA
ncbi:hypothetical protein [Sulfuriferula nivalis]|uniref:Uncharacterized protein n=1 Tax=Sulfuriferula nivalis TaxID=2675298 RepID=A0A809S515_9PROT|nr:hypothetical protein [Sulfuriferula nivalis]BBP02218.1 hypothetical protein SFSGTM_29260 [Sulfuriferula nivalis]